MAALLGLMTGAFHGLPVAGPAPETLDRRWQTRERYQRGGSNVRWSQRGDLHAAFYVMRDVKEHSKLSAAEKRKARNKAEEAAPEGSMKPVSLVRPPPGRFVVVLAGIAIASSDDEKSANAYLFMATLPAWKAIADACQQTGSQIYCGVVDSADREVRA